MSSPPSQLREYQQLKRGQARRVSLPTALPLYHQQQQQGNGRSPRSRTPNSLSPKLGFLKEISEFDIDPPFISPAASSSSSTENSHCNSPMLLSPSSQRPASARLYRRNRGSQPTNAGAADRNSPSHQRKLNNSTAAASAGSRSLRARQSEPAYGGEPDDDGFRWTDVDGFYGRKNSIPLQQLLANDLALLNGMDLKGGGGGNSAGDRQSPKHSPKHSPTKNGGGNNNGYLLGVDQSQLNGGAINIPSDITEDEEEETAAAAAEHHRERAATTTLDGIGSQQPEVKKSPDKEVFGEVKKSSSAPMSSPTKRRLMMLSNRLYSLEGRQQQEHKEAKKNQQQATGEEEEEGEESSSADEPNSEQTALEAVGRLTELQRALNGSGSNKVKFMDSVDELETLHKEEEGEEQQQHRRTTATTATATGSSAAGDDDIRQLRRAMKARKRQSRLPAAAQQLRHFSIDSNGHRVVDSGIRTIRAKAGQPLPTAKPMGTPRNPKARRATCPEIWLSVVEDEQRPVVQCAVRLFGCSSVGKKCIAKQLASTAEIAAPDDDIVSTESEDLQRPYRTVSFLLNEHEVHTEIIQGSMLPETRKEGAGDLGEMTIFAVVYSIDNRESFIRAAQILYRLYGDREQQKQQKEKTGLKQKAMDRACVPLVLIANKSDLQRKRKVSSIEGKMLAKIYKCPFVEISALLGANVDTLWREVVRKLFKYMQARDRLLQQQQRQDSEGSDNSSPRLLGRQPLVGRIVERTRRFAKSCEDWIAARIVAI